MQIFLEGQRHQNRQPFGKRGVYVITKCLQQSVLEESRINEGNDEDYYGVNLWMEPINGWNGINQWMDGINIWIEALNGWRSQAIPNHHSSHTSNMQRV